MFVNDDAVPVGRCHRDGGAEAEAAPGLDRGQCAPGSPVPCRCRVDAERQAEPGLGRPEGTHPGGGLLGPGAALVGAGEQPYRVKSLGATGDRHVDHLNPAACGRRGRRGQVEHDLGHRGTGHGGERVGDRGSGRVEDLGPARRWPARSAHSPARVAGRTADASARRRHRSSTPRRRPRRRKRPDRSQGARRSRWSARCCVGSRYRSGSDRADAIRCRRCS
jgi:hypothetical protein